ncbi:MAG: mannitol dehydrogenase family protein [Caulobacterales bacterium]|nr:mannitol dehydrogenase family protein [Caulobacterales bacterium]MCA0373533.1 mannitol dehydrogenase family protein [Pseudomonadota bacterium]
MIALNQENLPLIAQNAILPKYNRDETQIGVVHFGPGVFHRAHQAYYFDKLLEINPNYAICEVSLHSTNVRDAILPQDNLYTIAQIDAEPKMQIIGSIMGFLVAPENPQKVIDVLANENIKFVTSTITEKGYYLDNQGKLDFSAPEIAHDLENPNNPKSYIGFIMAGLRARKVKGLPPFTIIICDNLSNNGNLIKAAIIDFARQSDSQMLDYIKNLQCPCTMVDSITPATDDALRNRVAAKIGAKDNWPIARESFTQWIIEDFENNNEIEWQKIGVEITKDIKQYERAKLKILNGAHSSMAYFGILKGHKNVYDTTQDKEIMSLIKDMIFNEIIPLINADFSLENYANSVLKRFENPVIDHQISQISWDGSKKLPVRLLQSIIEAISQNKPFENMAFAIACWFAFIGKMAKSNTKIIDPIGEKLNQIGKGLKGDIYDVDILIDATGIFDETLRQSQIFIDTLKSKYIKAISYKEAQYENA